MAAIPRKVLAGATVVVTRPAAPATFLRRIREAGGTPLRLPGLSLRPAPDAVQARGALVAAQSADACIFISPAAVRFASRLLPLATSKLPRLVIAVGAGTQRALRHHGVPSLAPQRADSDGVLALPELARISGWRIALVGAPGGRGRMAPELHSRGARVEPVDVYRRAPPRLDRRHAEALAGARSPLLLLVSSGEALGHLVRWLPPESLARLRAGTVVASSDRLVDLARGFGFTRHVLAASAAPADLVAAAAAAVAGGTRPAPRRARAAATGQLG
jgi:uroporphyrinogen-III synthase